MRNLLRLIAAFTLVILAGIANAVTTADYMVTMSGSTIDDLLGVPLSLQQGSTGSYTTPTGPGTVTFVDGVFDSISFTLHSTFSISALPGSATLSSAITFDSTGIGSEWLLDCVGITSICGEITTGVVVPFIAIDLDVSNLDHISWSTITHQGGPINTTTTTRYFVATPVPVPAAAWFFVSALLSLTATRAHLIGKARKHS